MGGGILMFITPVSLRRSEFVVDWQSTERLPWGILLLFGGGLCLAKGMEETGIVQLVGDTIAGQGRLSLWVIMLLLTAVMLFMTEVMSNVALTVIFVPVVLSMADSLEVNPLYLAVPVTLAASCAFMMPISTPPNAVVYSSGHIRMYDMLRAGILLNILSILVLVLVGLSLVQWVYG
jgi:sodium-dependent dicarboxylate transporter 2/3/5